MHKMGTGFASTTGGAMAVSQAREEMLAVLVAVVMMLVMLTMITANSYWAMHCISVHMEYLLDLPNNPKV